MCHEYGHATLPPYNGFKKPETFANGMLGEKMYMRYLRNQFKQKSVAAEDVLGVTGAQLDSFVQKEVNPFIKVGLGRAPVKANMQLPTDAGMNNFLSVILAMQATMPSKVFAETLKRSESKKGSSYLETLDSVLKQQTKVIFIIPAELKLQQVWLPVSAAKLEMGTVIATSGSWALVKPVKNVVSARFNPDPKAFVAPNPAFGG